MGCVLPLFSLTHIHSHKKIELTPRGGASSANFTPPPPRRLRFRHVRVNRMHARITYAGPPISITDFGLVLDNRVYRNLEGGWVTLLNR